MTVSVAVLLLPANVPVMVTVDWELTLIWPTLKVAPVFPAAIVTVAGTVAAAVFALARTTFIPPEGAGLEIVTVPVTAVVALPLTAPGETVTDTSVGASTLIPANCELEPYDAVTAPEVLAVTAFVVTAKLVAAR